MVIFAWNLPFFAWNWLFLKTFSCRLYYLVKNRLLVFALNFFVLRNELLFAISWLFVKIMTWGFLFWYFLAMLIKMRSRSKVKVMTYILTFRFFALKWSFLHEIYHFLHEIGYFWRHLVANFTILSKIGYAFLN